MRLLGFSIAPALKEQATGLSAAGPQSRLRQGLIVAQICVSLWLLIGAVLFTRSLLNLLRGDPGLRTAGLVTL